ncbi:MAG: OmpA family protein [Myxococcota bacterium]
MSALLVAAPLRPARAELGYAVHFEGTAARAVGDPKAQQFGWGGGAWLAPELTLNPYIGLELSLGGVALTDGGVDPDGLVPTEGGFGLFALPGVRLRPFGRPEADATWSLGGLWVAGGAGITLTGDLVRPSIDSRVGFDFAPGHALRVGPFVGYVHIIDPSSEVFAEDARLLSFGLHAAFEPRPDIVTTASDPDRDGDGVRDQADACPDDAEDRDDFDDDDGCPDHDNDGDDIPDHDDACPDDAEDRDDFDDDDGCPDHDNDGDDIPDLRDACPDDAEDRDGFDDDDGCPDPDNDGDDIPDLRDACPDDAETRNDYDDHDGCPDEVQVRLVGNEIRLDDRVHFGVDTAFIERRSHPLVGRLAKLMNDHPHWTRIRIQGHADDTGPDGYNHRLSAARATAVRGLLVQLGVRPGRLVTEAFGERRPAVPDTTPTARDRNRRVEFLILEREPQRER